MTEGSSSQYDEKELFRRLKHTKSNDERKVFRDLIIVHYNKFVHNMAFTYQTRLSHIPFEDILQCGMKGLLMAIDKYNLESGSRFMIYASWWIQQNIQILSGNREL